MSKHIRVVRLGEEHEFTPRNTTNALPITAGHRGNPHVPTYA